MMKDTGWGHDLVSPFDSPFGLESMSFGLEDGNILTQGPTPRPIVPWFNPVSIVAEEGVFYASIYVCRLTDDKALTQRFAIWLNSLKETDHIKLSVSATISGIPFSALMSLLSALANTKAKIDIILDQIVMDGLAYFYLLADTILVRAAGALYIESYVEQRPEDMSATWKAIHDFYSWIVEDASVRGILTSEEAEALNGGTDVVPDLQRFAK